MDTEKNVAMLRYDAYRHQGSFQVRKTTLLMVYYNRVFSERKMPHFAINHYTFHYRDATLQKHFKSLIFFKGQEMFRISC